MGKPAIHVLLVEDNDGDVMLIEEMLAETPEACFELTAVDRLAAAVKRVGQGDVSVVLLDLSLPDSQGTETFRALRRSSPDVPVVVLTGLDDADTAQVAVQEGAQDYLVKGQISGPQLAHSLWYSVLRRARLRHLEGVLEATEAELQLAHKIHQALLPRSDPRLLGLDIHGSSRCAGAAGGDLLQYLNLADGTLAVAVADVTSHGVGPALLMVAVRSYLRAFAQSQTDPGSILFLVNRLFAEDVTDGNNCTLFLAKLDPIRRTLVYASAGHHPPGLVFAADGTVKQRLYSTGVPLGVEASSPFPTAGPMELERGDLIVLLTDGVVEARSPEGLMFGEGRARDEVQKHCHQSAREIVEALFQAVDAFRASQAQTDDITAIVIKVGAGLLA
jgi:serine phosphatase RsbU (regulator of sigma subunit)